MRPKLYVLPASHPCAAVEAALGLKGIEFDRVMLLPLTQLIVGPVRYGGVTVPGLRLGRERIVGSRAIMRRADVLAPDPPLLPPVDDPLRTAILEAERWGDEVLQAGTRRIIDAAFIRHPASMATYAVPGELPLPMGLLRPTMPAVARLMAVRNRALGSAARRDLEALPGWLDRLDAWLGDGLIGGEQPNAADLQLGSSVRLLLTVADLRPLIEPRPAARLVRWFPAARGEMPAGTLPAEWLPGPDGYGSRP